MRNLAYTTGTPAWLLWWVVAALLSLTLFVVVMPTMLFAANVSMGGSDAQIQVAVSGTTITLQTSGTHSVDSITVGDSSFDAVISNGSLVVTSSGKYDMSASPSQFSTFTCETDQSKMSLSNNDGTARTITVTPKTTVCATGGGGGGSSGGTSGASSGGSAAAAYSSTAVPVATDVVPAAVATAPAVVTAAPSSELSQLVELFIAMGIIPSDKAANARKALADTAPTVAVSATFSRGIGNGAKGEDVKRLQVLLNSDSDTKVSASGAGSPGSETETFGPATESAVKKFQVKYGIAGPGSEGYGFVGPKTRAKLEEVFGGTGVPAASVASPSPVAAAVSPVFNGTLSSGMENADVKRLQQLLNSDPDTRVASSGAGSVGNETNFFGPATEAAVKKFQAKYGIVSSGTPATTGYGLVGAKTRAKLQEVFGK
ncbi:MAG: peptidoglycan-binding protein [Parcubacteria group bacterium]|nr:peptidoglycan-binding protein [Parcubacteria group bacterium]MBI3075217.1 peptidoglycan-binding protein [Parcubacteria group bacterium]